MSAEDTGEVCKACGKNLKEAPSSGGTGLADLAGEAPNPGDENAPQADTGQQPAGVEVDKYGAYGKAADAAWEDPAEKVAREQAEAAAALPDVPEEVLQAHKAAAARRNNRMGLAAVGVIAVIVLIWLAFRN